jgi:putative ATP-dependent endonuclease of OLD family
MRMTDTPETPSPNVPWRLISLSIERFRRFDRVQLRFPQRLCILGGLSSGKTTLADAIRILFHPGRGAGRLRLNEWDFFDREPAAGERATFDIQGLVGPLSKNLVGAPPFILDLLEYADEETLQPTESPQPSTSRVVRLGVRGYWDPQEGTLEYDHYSPKLSIGDSLVSIPANARAWFGVSVIGSRRVFREELSPHSRSSIARLLEARGARLPEVSRAFASLLGNAGGEVSKRADVGSVLEQLDRRLSGLVGSNDLGLQFGVGVSSSGSALTHLSLLTETGLPLELEGGGISSAAVLAALLELAGSGVLVIDSPETSLPPPVQRAAIGRVLSEERQVLVTTHSPSVTSLFTPDEILVLRNPGTPVLLRDLLSKISSAGQLRKFWRTRPGYLAALSGTWTLIVEGAGDAVVYERMLTEVARREGTFADLLGFWILDGGGTDSTHLLEFLRECGVLTCALVDGDKKGRELQNFVRASSVLVTLEPGEDLESLLSSCTTDPQLGARIGRLKANKGNIEEYMVITDEIISDGHFEPFVALFTKVLTSVQEFSSGSQDGSDSNQ